METTNKTIRVEVLRTESNGRHTYSVFELPAECERILVDADRIYGDAWGFLPSQEHVNGKLLEMTDAQIMMGGDA